MNNGLMIDAVFALVLILSVVFGAKRGLFRSFMALAAIVLALIGASLLTDALTEPAAYVWQDDAPVAVTCLLKKLLRFDFDGAVRQSLRNAARDAALAAVRTLLGSVVRTLVFVLCFLVLTLLLRLVTGGIDKVLDLPVLNALNTIGGGALGLIEGALLLFLVCDVAPKLGVKAFAAYEGP